MRAGAPRAPGGTPARVTDLAHACEPAPSGDVSGTPPSTASAQQSSARLVGIDAARGVALFGMMAVHNITAVDDGGDASLAWTLAAGKSAALFALLAGVGVAFATGRRQRPTARTWPGYAAALLVRALIIGGVGLLLGAVVSADSAEVILPYYALLFVFAIPLLTLSSRALIALAAAIAVVMPILSHWLRSGTEVRDTVPNLTFGDLLSEPGRVLGELALTGVYPALPWMAYLCAGLAVGRALLTSRRTVTLITLTGAGLVVAAQTISWFLLDVLDGRAELEATMSSGELAKVMAVGWTGTTPTDTAWWLATLAPHSTTPLDLAFTIGLGLVVLGGAILLGRTTTALVRPLAAPGSMTLTLYSLHLLLLSWWVMPGEATGLLIQTVVVVAFALVWSRYHARGPLEEIVARASGAVRRGVQAVAEPRSVDLGHVVATLVRQDGRRRQGRPAPAGPDLEVLRARVRDALAGAGCWQEFADRLSVDGVLVRARYSTVEPDEVTGYAVALRPVGRDANDHRQPVWYGGGKLGPDLTFPRLRQRWIAGQGGGASERDDRPAYRSVRRDGPQQPAPPVRESPVLDADGRVRAP